MKEVKANVKCRKEHAAHMIARLVDGPIRERKTVVARFGAPEIMHTTIHGRVHLGAAAISRESNY